jgi:hypothetical protein
VQSSKSGGQSLKAQVDAVALQRSPAWGGLHAAGRMPSRCQRAQDMMSQTVAGLLTQWVECSVPRAKGTGGRPGEGSTGPEVAVPARSVATVDEPGICFPPRPVAPRFEAVRLLCVQHGICLTGISVVGANP